MINEKSTYIFIQNKSPTFLALNIEIPASPKKKTLWPTPKTHTEKGHQTHPSTMSENQNNDAESEIEISDHRTGDPVHSTFSGNSPVHITDWFEEAPMAMNWLDRSGIILGANQQELNLLGYTREEYVGHPISQFHVDQPVIGELLHRLAAGETLDSYPARLRRKDGSIQEVEINANANYQNKNFLYSRCITRSLTDSRSGTKAGHTMESLGRATLDAAHDAILTIDVAGTIESVNPAAETLFGYPATEILGKQIGKIIPIPATENLEGNWLRFLAPNIDQENNAIREVIAIRKDGTTFPAEIALNEFFHRELHLFTGIVQDISKLKNAEEALQQSEQRFHLCVAGSNDGIWDWNKVTNTVFLAPRVKELLGYQPEQLNGPVESWQTLLHADDQQQVLSVLQDHLNNRTSCEIDIRLKCKSGEFRWFRARGKGIWDQTGNIQRMAGSLTDINNEKETAQKLEIAKKALIDSEFQMRAIIEATPECVKLIDAEGRLLQMNSAGLSYIEVDSLDEIRGTCVYPIIADEYRDQFRRLNEDVCRGSRGRMQFEIIGMKGTRRYMETNAVPIKTKEGDTVQLAITHEITERKRQDSALKAAKESAEAANLAKSEFLANMSHEIRTPMNGIIGMADLALDTTLTGEQREYLEIVKESGDALLEIVNDILDFSKIEAGKLELEDRPFSLKKTIDGIFKTLSCRAEQKGLKVAWEVASDLPDRLVGDNHRLRQVIVNLVGNAIKFTANGSVTLKAIRDRRSRDGMMVLFQITDTGIGISEKKQAAIFEPFSQADTSNTRTYGGTGLGLAICSQLVQLLGGRIWVNSQEGRGSTFNFNCKFEVENQVLDNPITQKPTSQPYPAATNRKIRSLKILLVEDHLVNQRFASRLLEKQGHSIQLANTGIEAIQVYQNNDIDLILMDIQMPGIDGLEATKQIRKLERLSGHRTPIIAMTAHAMKGDAERCLDVGMDGYVTKPVAQDKLVAEIKKVLENSDLQASQESENQININNTIFNYENALQQVDGDRELLLELIQIHLTETTKLTDQIANAIDSLNCQAVKTAAHTLRGSVGIFCATRAFEAISQLEKSAAEGKLGDCESYFEEMKYELNRLEELLRSLTEDQPHPDFHKVV